MRLTEKAHARDKRPRQKNFFAPLSGTANGLPARRTVFFLLFNLLFGVVFASHLARLFEFSLQYNHYSHFILIPLVSFYLLAARRRTLIERAEYGLRAGVVIGLIGGLSFLAGLALQSQLSQNDFLSLSTLGVVGIWIGGFVTCFGLPAARIALFPLGFLLFAVPLPEALLSGVITALQYASAEVSYALFKLTPVPIFRQGITFALPDLTIEVAKECSSIRSSLALLITGVMANHLLLQRWWSKATILLLVFPLAVFKNGVRIVALSLLTIYVDRGFIEGSLHTRGGIVFFCLALALLVPIFLGLRKLETRHSGAPAREA